MLLCAVPGGGAGVGWQQLLLPIYMYCLQNAACRFVAGAMGRQAGRQVGRQTGRQAGTDIRQTHMHSYCSACCDASPSSPSCCLFLFPSHPDLAGWRAGGLVLRRNATRHAAGFTGSPSSLMFAVKRIHVRSTSMESMRMRANEATCLSDIPYSKVDAVSR